VVGLEEQIREIFGIRFPGGVDARECVSRFLVKGDVGTAVLMG
jgi:hypothetical protein